MKHGRSFLFMILLMISSCAYRNEEAAALASYISLMQGESTLLNDPELATFWETTILPFSELEYTLMDLDKDGISELIVQTVDDPSSYQGVFAYKEGRIDCWQSDSTENTAFNYPLTDGTMVHQYNYDQTQTYRLFHYNTKGEEITITQLFTQTLADDRNVENVIYEIDGKITDAKQFEAVVSEQITEKRLPKEVWTPVRSDT